MRNKDNWENSINRNIRSFMNDQNIMFGYIPSIKTRKIGKGQSINFDEYPKLFLWYTPFYLGNIVSLAKILRALLSNKNRILHLWKKPIIK